MPSAIKDRLMDSMKNQIRVLQNKGVNLDSETGTVMSCSEVGEKSHRIIFDITEEAIPLDTMVKAWKKNTK